MDRLATTHRSLRLALFVVSLVVLLGLLCGLAWSTAGLANEREPARDPSTCQQPEGLSPRGAEILCTVGESEPAALEYMARNATPVPEPDVLDGDPLDGPARTKRLPDPENATPLPIVQSGRQKDTPNSTSLYDGDGSTSWSPRNVDEPWVWLDLGDTEAVRNVRWLAGGSGDVEIAVSSDRKRWSVLDTQPISGDWQEVELREDAQYVRLTLLPEDDTSRVDLAEVEVFGRERKADTSLAQEAKKGNKKRDKRRAAERAQDAAAAAEPAADNPSDNKRGSVNSSAKAGETKCSGKRERCRARPGKVEVTDDCGGNGTCTIDIRADGGSAICDASGGNEDRAGDGEGKRGGGNGGRCEAVADGGTVIIGDVNP